MKGKEVWRTHECDIGLVSDIQRGNPEAQTKRKHCATSRGEEKEGRYALEGRSKTTGEEQEKEAGETQQARCLAYALLSSITNTY